MLQIASKLLQYAVTNRWDGKVQFTAEIECTDDASISVKLGLAVRWAIKNRADLRSADLSGADLSGANLRSADLRSADLRSADLSGANLRSADLRSADLSGADLRSADLSGADLSGADLSGANLRSADLRSAIGSDLAIARTRILPEEGDIVGWKKCINGVIVKLRIPAKAKRSHAFGRKCRAAYADVLQVITPKGHKGPKVGVSAHDGVTKYQKGKRVKADHFNPNWQEECAGGIHFFITRIEAENY